MGTKDEEQEGQTLMENKEIEEESRQFSEKCEKRRPQKSKTSIRGGEVSLIYSQKRKEKEMEVEGKHSWEDGRRL